MLKEDKINLINSNIVSIVILANIIQLNIAWIFNVSMNLILQYVLIVFLFIVNRKTVKSMATIILILVVAIVFLINKILYDSTILDEYINMYSIVALPLVMIFSFKIDYKTLASTFNIYAIINAVMGIYIIFAKPDVLATDYMTLGYNLIFCLSYILIYNFKKRKKLMVLLAIVGSVITVIYTTRGAINVVIVSIIISMMLEKNTKKKNITVAILITSAFVLIYNIHYVLEFIIFELEIDSYAMRQFYYMVESNSVEQLVGSRYPIYVESIMYFQDKLILGNGIGTFHNEYGTYPHNILLDIYVTFGIILGTVLVLYLIYVGIRAIKRANNKYQIIFIIFAIGNMAKLLTSKVFIYDPTFWLYIGITFNICMNKMEERKHNEDNSIYTNIQQGRKDSEIVRITEEANEK